MFVKGLNNFYSRFDIKDNSGTCRFLLKVIPIGEPAQQAPFREEDVHQQLRKCKLGKAPGPDGIQACVLKDCATELSPIIHTLFSASRRTVTVPVLWKTSTIITIRGVSSWYQYQ